MADGGPLPEVADGTRDADQEARLKALMDPAKLEARLVEARARRAKVLAERGQDAGPKRPRAKRTSPLEGGAQGSTGGAAVPREEVAPRDEIGAREDAVVREEAIPRADLDPDRFVWVEAEPAMDAEPHGLPTLRPVPYAPPHPIPTTSPHLSDAETAPGGQGSSEAAASRPAPAPRARLRRRLAVPFVVSLVGAVAGVGAAVLVPGLTGWEIVLVRPGAGDGPATEGAVGPTREPAAADTTGRTDAGDGAAPATPPRADPVAPARTPTDAEPVPTASELAAPSDWAMPAVPAPPSPADEVSSVVPTIDGPAAAPPTQAETSAPRVAPETLPVPERTDGAEFAALDRAETPALGTPAAPGTEPVPSSLRVPPPPAEPDPTASPATRGTTIMMHYPPDTGDAAAVAERALVLAGIENVVLREVGFTISQPNVRYYHEADRAAANELSDLLSVALDGDDVAARDFTDYQPTPAAGMLEVWLDGSAPAAPRVETAARTPVAPRETVRERAAPVAPRVDPVETERNRLRGLIEQRLRDELR